MYTTVFTTPPIPSGGRALLHFYGLVFLSPWADQPFPVGINYRASITINNVTLAISNDVVGSFRYFEFDITDVLAPSNTLRVEVSDHSPSAQSSVLYLIGCVPVLCWLADIRPGASPSKPDP